MLALIILLNIAFSTAGLSEMYIIHAQMAMQSYNTNLSNCKIGGFPFQNSTKNLRKMDIDFGRENYGRFDTSDLLIWG